MRIGLYDTIFPAGRGEARGEDREKGRQGDVSRLLLVSCLLVSCLSVSAVFDTSNRKLIIEALAILKNSVKSGTAPQGPIAQPRCGS
jgi:hypothetical protein